MSLMHTPERLVALRTHAEMFLTAQAKGVFRHSDRCADFWHVERSIRRLFEQTVETLHYHPVTALHQLDWSESDSLRQETNAPMSDCCKLRCWCVLSEKRRRWVQASQCLHGLRSRCECQRIGRRRLVAASNAPEGPRDRRVRPGRHAR